jgi:histidinol dehydrogenase
MNRKTIIAKALKARGALIHTKDMAEAITLSNQILARILRV